MFRAPMAVAFPEPDWGSLGVAALIVVVVCGVACFTATFGYLRAKRAAAEREMAEERELEADGLN
jgi:hypothetical protein